MKMVNFICFYCGGPGKKRLHAYKKNKRHFCKRACYTNYRREMLPKEEQNAWQGGVSHKESLRRYYQKNKAAQNARRKKRLEREMNAPGSHTPGEWLHIKENKYKNRCAEADDTCSGPLTKDHKVPITMGGSNNPENLQPLCKSHNSRKARKVYLGTFSADD